MGPQHALVNIKRALGDYIEGLHGQEDLETEAGTWVGQTTVAKGYALSYCLLCSFQLKVFDDIDHGDLQP